MSWIPACVLCLTGECLHAIEEGKETLCRGRAAVTELSGSALCEGCANGAVAVELAIRMEEEARQNATDDVSPESVTEADSEVSRSVRKANELWRIDPNNPGGGT